MATLRPEDNIWYVWWKEDNLDHPHTICNPDVLIKTIKIRAPCLAETCRRNREAGYIWTGALKGPTSGLWYYYNEDSCDEFLHDAEEWGIIPPLEKT